MDVDINNKHNVHANDQCEPVRRRDGVAQPESDKLHIRNKCYSDGDGGERLHVYWVVGGVDVYKFFRDDYNEWRQNAGG